MKVRKGFRQPGRVVIIDGIYCRYGSDFVASGVLENPMRSNAIKESVGVKFECRGSCAARRRNGNEGPPLGFAVRFLSVLAATLAVGATSLAVDEPEFTFSFAPCSGRVERAAGTTFRQELDVLLTTRNNPDAEAGALGWSMSLIAQGVEIVDITTQGTVAASVDDDPPGLREDGFEVTELAVRGVSGCDGPSGAITATTLSLVKPLTLPPEGTVTVARLTVTGTLPQESGEVVTARLSFVNGCIGTGMSVSNWVVWKGSSVRPLVEDCELELVAGPENFLRGDANDDSVVDLSDAIFILYCKFLGGTCPDCRDAADSNDDGTVDVSDPIYLINTLFLGGASPPIPGPDACGTDPTEDALPVCAYRSCSGDLVPALR